MAAKSMQLKKKKWHYDNEENDNICENWKISSQYLISK